MNKKSVAIVIPTLNEEKFIGRCLESVLSQSFPIDEMDILVVDGGSGDGTCKIVEEYHSKHPNIRFIHNPQKIQSAAFNIGVANSDAPYVIRLDAHATYNKDYIAICYELLRKNPTFGNVGGVCDIKAQNDSLEAETNAVVNKVKFGIGGASFRIGAAAGSVDTVPFGAFPRKVIEEVGGMRDDLARGEDNEYNSRIHKAGYTIYLDPRIISSYYARPDLKSSCKQMFNNGLSIGKLLHIDRNAIGIRHLVPLVFVLSIIGSCIASIIWYKLWILIVGILALYLFAAIIATINACRQYGFRFFFILPIYFFCIHVSYGIGTLIGILK